MDEFTLLFEVTKWVSLVLFIIGFTLSVFQARIAGLSLWMTLGLAGLWLSGYGLLKVNGVNMNEPWVGVTLLSSLASFTAVGLSLCYRQLWLRAVAIVLSSSALGTMLFHQDLSMVLIAISSCSAIVLAFIRGIPQETMSLEQVREQIEPSITHWFVWLARLEGLSLLVLFGIYMPLKYAAGIVLDGGHGWVGWVHGMMQMLYLSALVITWKVRQLSNSDFVIGGVASLLPFGTFWFERRLTRSHR